MWKLREKRQTEGTYRPSSEEQFSHAAEARAPQDSKEMVRGRLAFRPRPPGPAGASKVVPRPAWPSRPGLAPPKARRHLADTERFMCSWVVKVGHLGLCHQGALREPQRSCLLVCAKCEGCCVVGRASRDSAGFGAMEEG